MYLFNCRWNAFSNIHTDMQVHLVVCPGVDNDKNLIETWSITFYSNISNDITMYSASCVISQSTVHDHVSPHVANKYENKFKIFPSDNTPGTIIIATICYYN